LESISQQSFKNLRVVVVADNCNDDTAEVARAHGAEVVERFNDHLRGKGYALDFGVKYLGTNTPPEIVIILDADCFLHQGALLGLIAETLQYQRPIQALYLMYTKPDSPLKSKIAEFAWTVKNWARPLGFHRLGLPCQLMGSGMAFPWSVIENVNLATGHIVEDMKLGADLALLNLAPRFCPDALVTSYFPSNDVGIKSQRTRWEHGHIGMIVKESPILLCNSLRHANVRMLALALDMMVPPLALLLLIIIAAAFFGMLTSVLSQQWLPWGLPIIHLIIVAIAVMLAWVKYGRHILSLKDLMAAPFYVLAKIPLYVKFVFKRQSEWVRSKRDS
jgi:cellulose synthase/poly-beta-1,6-N-acetylglucosamine synthase-like glycosyltransferase